MQPCEETEEGVAKAGMPGQEPAFRARPAQVHDERPALELPLQTLRQGRGAGPVEVPGGRVPDDLTCGQDQDQVLDRMAFEPAPEVRGDPLGPGGLAGGQQDEPPCARERLVGAALPGAPCQ